MPPRIVWLMLPAGSPTEHTIDELSNLLGADDVVVDGGNSHYRDSIRRAEALSRSGIYLVDVGTSGGIEGAERGYALMIGGPEVTIRYLSPIFQALAADAEKSWGRVGVTGAGHFAKMVHNGVEYGMKRTYAQGLTALDNCEEFGFDLSAVTDIWRHGAMARSVILDLTHEALTGNPELGPLAPYVADVAPGRRTKQDAIDQIAQRGYDRDQFAS
jgi:6-phosphogluconate dehydrogenase